MFSSQFADGTKYELEAINLATPKLVLFFLPQKANKTEMFKIETTIRISAFFLKV